MQGNRWYYEQRFSLNLGSNHTRDYELIYPTGHLNNFDTLNSGIGLIGDSYRVAGKQVWYGTHGESIKRHIIKLGGIKTDIRMNSAYIFPSGRGKNHIIHALDQICQKLGEKVSKPTSLHPEQLVGKVLRLDDKKGGTKYEQVKGHLADDALLLDDAIDVVRGNEPQYKESRKYIEKALDPIGENGIEKRMVDTPREYALRYFPSCTIFLFFQPYPLPDEAILSGLFRRFIPIYIPMGGGNRDEEFAQKVLGEGREEQALSEFASYLIDLRSKSSEPPSILDYEVKEQFIRLHSQLCRFGKSFGPKSSNFTDMIDYSLQSQLLKMATILAYSQSRDKVEVVDIELAFVDLLEFSLSTFNFVENKVMGSLDYGETWRGAVGKDQEALSWLYNQGAFSEESSKVSIKDYIEKVSEIFTVKEDGARKRYQKHKEKGWIESKQTGSHDSVVYLNFTPLFKDVGDQGDRVIHIYRDIVGKYSTPATSEQLSFYPSFS